MISGDLFFGVRREASWELAGSRAYIGSKDARSISLKISG